MMDEKYNFKLSAREMEYLNQLASRDKSLASLLKSQKGTFDCSLAIRLSRDEAEQVRERLTTELAAIGFDCDYSPNADGRMLETLIDRFYVTT